jgi:hypothetical protein
MTAHESNRASQHDRLLIDICGIHGQRWSVLIVVCLSCHNINIVIYRTMSNHRLVLQGYEQDELKQYLCEWCKSMFSNIRSILSTRQHKYDCTQIVRVCMCLVLGRCRCSMSTNENKWTTRQRIRTNNIDSTGISTWTYVVIVFFF